MTKKTIKTNEDFDYKTIKTFKDACIKTGTNFFFTRIIIAIINFLLPNKFAKPIIAHYKLIIVYMAINNGWIPDWGNDDQYKYSPWFGVLSSGFGFSGSGYGYGRTGTRSGSRLCTDTSGKARYMAEQFESEYKDYLLYSE